ncbi:hypothetical protein [Agitococcus lubricus]|uniref:Lysyl-tRNA synthetase class 2 n=1 Tax=Agitococcus lubricus TaxID=1077255 RepID=A0A2T5IUY7_9GAMM|nr:hypothetical protein [Agitococcus lubricus]PTQ87700.1 lysyl-tRNA synthetase class 2 [Agitococcus lubricus]
MASTLAPLEIIRLRAYLLARIRSFFQQRTVLEVDSMTLSRLPSALKVGVGHIDAYLPESIDAIMRELANLTGQSVYQVGHLYRDEPKSRKHLAEFCLVSWWQQGSFTALKQQLSELVAYLCGSSELVWQERPYVDAFQQRLNLDIRQASLKTCKEAANSLGVRQQGGDQVQAWISLLYRHFIEPTLGYEQALLLTEIPQTFMPMAQIKQEYVALTTTESAYLYIDGLKLATIQQCGEYGGVSLGFERLAMLLAEQMRIDHVCWQPAHAQTKVELNP